MFVDVGAWSIYRGCMKTLKNKSRRGMVWQIQDPIEKKKLIPLVMSHQKYWLPPQCRYGREHSKRAMRLE